MSYEAYYEHGQLHCIDKPARIWYNKNGTKEMEEYYIDGKYYKDVFKWMIEVGGFEERMI